MRTGPPVIHYEQATATVSRWRHGDWNISLRSLESSPDIRKGGIHRSDNEGIGMNPLGTIGGNLPNCNGRGGFGIFNSFTGIPDFTNRSVPWHGAMIGENSGCDSLFKNAESENILKLKNIGAEMMKFSFKLLMPTNLIPVESTNIKPENQYDSSESCSLQKIMSCESHDPCARTDSTS